MGRVPWHPLQQRRITRDQQKLKAENHHPLIRPLPMTHLPQAVRMMTSTKGRRRARKRNPLLLHLGVKERSIDTRGRKRKKKKRKKEKKKNSRYSGPSKFSG